ncbi:hypothetical protein NKJ26_16990 [Mesorhizobium sp. M0152]|uniref:hypothetical protein n=1 Tax=unclassified Mesorhizobium TaxID=325217 RepID=UPI00333DAE3C
MPGKQDVRNRNRVVGATKFFGTVVFILLLVGVVVGFLQFLHVWGSPTDENPTTIENPRDREAPESNPLERAWRAPQRILQDVREETSQFMVDSARGTKQMPIRTKANEAGVFGPTELALLDGFSSD